MLLSVTMDQASQQDFPNCLGLSRGHEAGRLAPCGIAIRLWLGRNSSSLCPSRCLALGLQAEERPALPDCWPWVLLLLLLCLKEGAHRGFGEMADHPVSAVPPGRNKGKSWIQLACPTGETVAGFGQRWMDEPSPELVAMLLPEPRGPRAPKGEEGRGWSMAVLSHIQRPGVASCQKSCSCLKNHKPY